jgi:hypothetical protein
VNLGLFIVPAIVLPLLSCSGGKVDPARPAQSHQSFSQRLNENNGYVQDKQGNWAPRSDKRSSFELVGESPYFKGEHSKKEYKPAVYRKSSWSGKQEFTKSVWQGGADGSRFQTAARQQGQAARESGTAARMPGQYNAGAYATGSAREAHAREVPRVADAETESRRDVYQPPEVIDWRQRRSLSKDQTKALLGR